LPAGPERRNGHADRLAERELREEVRADLDRLLGERQLLAPGPEDEARIRTLIPQRIARYHRPPAATNRPPLPHPAGVARRLFDGLLRLGPLQVLADDPEVEEIVANGPRVFAYRRGRKELADVSVDDEELLHLVRRLIGPLGKRL